MDFLVRLIISKIEIFIEIIVAHFWITVSAFVVSVDCCNYDDFIGAHQPCL